MRKQSRAPPTHFFTLRLWAEERGEEQSVWWGRIQNTA